MLCPAMHSFVTACCPTTAAAKAMHPALTLCAVRSACRRFRAPQLIATCGAHVLIGNNMPCVRMTSTCACELQGVATFSLCPVASLPPPGLRPALSAPRAPHISLALAGVEIISNGSGSHHQLRKLDTRVDLIQSATSKVSGVFLGGGQPQLDTKVTPLLGHQHTRLAPACVHQAMQRRVSSSADLALAQQPQWSLHPSTCI
jgi:hypothetical protein